MALVVQLDPDRSLRGLAPLGVDRGRERPAGARDLLREGRLRDQGRTGKYRGQHRSIELHKILHSAI